MNLFILDTDIDKCAEAHIDLHVGKMQLEATQLLSTALWVDKYIGYRPSALGKDELGYLKAKAAEEPTIEERTFTRYLPTHHNHPCAIWVRSSYDNYLWTLVYVNALNDENVWRGFKSHSSCEEANRLPAPINLPHVGLTPFAQAVPEEYKSDDPVDAYRHYYMGEKAPFAVWRRRGKPEWWDDMLADYKGGMDPHEGYKKTVKAAVNKGKPWSRMGVVGGGR